MRYGLCDGMRRIVGAYSLLALILAVGFAETGACRGEREIRKTFDEALEQGDLEKRNRLWKRIVYKSPDSPFGFYAQAELEFTKRKPDLEKVIELYTKASDLRSLSGLVYFRRAAAYRAKGDLDAAILDLVVAAELGLYRYRDVPVDYTGWGSDVALSVEKMREAYTKGCINALMSAISIYWGDYKEYPKNLDTSSDSPFSKYLERVPPVRATHMGIGAGTAESPYGSEVLVTEDEAGFEKGGKGWRYNPKTGHVFVNSASTDSRGVPYSTYGY